MVLVMRRLTQSECQWVKVRVIHNYKDADDQQNCAVNSIPLELKLKNSHYLKYKSEINSDLSSGCLRTDECTILQNTEIQAMSAFIVSTSESKRLETKTQSLSQFDSKSNMLNQESN